MKKIFTLVLLFTSSVLLNACKTTPPSTMDYGPLIESDPKSILVMMPSSVSNDIKASPAVLASTVLPLSEKGYYVMPVTMVTDTFYHNGVTTGEQMSEIPLSKLKEVYGADAVLYLNIPKYDISYKFFDSVATVTVEAKLVDLNTGAVLWGPYDATVNNKEKGGSSSIFGKMAKAVIKQIMNNVQDVGYDLSRDNAYMLYGDLHMKKNRNHKISLLHGKRSPLYRKDPDYLLYMKLNGKEVPNSNVNQ